jgi:hypothetical protein
VGLLDLSNKFYAAVAVIFGVPLGMGAFYITTRLLRSDEADVLARRLPIPRRVRAYLGV